MHSCSSTLFVSSVYFIVVVAFWNTIHLRVRDLVRRYTEDLKSFNILGCYKPIRTKFETPVPFDIWFSFLQSLLDEETPSLYLVNVTVLEGTKSHGIECYCI